MLPPIVRSLISRATLAAVGLALLGAAYRLVVAGVAMNREEAEQIARVGSGGASPGKQPPAGGIFICFGAGVALLGLPFVIAAVAPFSWYERLGRPNQIKLHENMTLDDVASSGGDGWINLGGPF